MNQLLKQGNKYLPRCVKIGNKYSVSKKNKGLHSKHVVIDMILYAKIKKEFMSYKDIATNVVYSMSTKSIYFSIGEELYRISDHKKPFKGKQIIVKWYN